MASVVLATTNKGKLRDFLALFEGSGIALRLPEEFGVALDVEENGATFEENALLKARAFARVLPGHAVLADDSGLGVDALGGRPGVHSARYAGRGGDDHANNRKLLEELRGSDDRRAAFVCVLALVLAGGAEIVAEGRCEGRIIEAEIGSNGFGYDPIFFRDDLGCTFGQATPEQKNARSHRAAAVAALLGKLGVAAGPGR
ncbi:MAG: RdgB/HAM1 family non-canonical purine NTP pyrophosphatase [Deltaproteobacteria bacterium]|nr:RdgB/HAM1 family non-canonical purine NTP pyrophosphatase [Deltaproteobacteria bacterium]